MSLMQLLTVTRSIKTVKDQPSPYKMKQSQLLPKFSARTGEAGPGAEEVEGVREAPVAAAPQDGGRVVPSFADAAPRKRRLLRFLNAWRFSRRPQNTRQSVQTELLLETVRVV